MAKSVRGQVAFVSGAVSVLARLTANNMCRHEDMTGETYQASLKVVTDNPDQAKFKQIRCVLHCCLPAEYTEEMTGELIDDIGVAEAFRLIVEVTEAAFPPAPVGDTEGNAKGKTPAPTMATT
jgi:hypothetical protein